MIIKSIKVQNWKTIKSFEIPDFSESITVIHAPNKTGKSSLADAICLSLLDLDYSSSKVDPYRPWSGGIPEVEIVFAVGKNTYLLRKKYAKSGGEASLNKLLPKGGMENIAKGKEVNGEVRRVLEFEDDVKSSIGIPQLLWVHQGVYDFPAIDGSLNNAISSVLGTLMVTEQDKKFRGKVSEKLHEWFKPSSIKNKNYDQKSGSRYARMQGEIETVSSELGDIEEKFRQMEHLIQESKRLEDELDRSSIVIEQSQKEFDELKSRSAQVEKKRLKFTELAGECDKRKEALKNYESKLGDMSRIAKEIKGISEILAQKKPAAAIIKESLGQAEESLRKTEEARKAAQTSLSGLEQKGEELSAKSKLIEIEKKTRDMKDLQERVAAFRKEQMERQHAISTLNFPRGTNISAIQKLLQEKLNCEAELKAAGFILKVTPKADLQFKIEIDGSQTEKAMAKGERAWEIDAKKNINIETESAIFEVRRAREGKVEDIEKEYDKICLQLEKHLKPLNLSIEQSAAEILTEVQTRNQQLANHQNAIAKLEADIKSLLGKLGQEFPEKELAGLEREKEDMLANYLSISNWKPSAETLSREKAEFDKAIRAGKAKLEQLQLEEERERENLKKISQTSQAIERDIIDFEAQLRTHKGELEAIAKSAGAENQLHEKIDATRADIEKLEAQKVAFTLTREEEELAQVAERDEFALKNRVARLQETKESLIRAETTLGDLSGLHPKRTSLEQKRTVLELEMKRLSIEQDAYKLIYELFENLREQNLRESLDPVTQNVEAWLRELEGGDSIKLIIGEDLKAKQISIDGGECRDIDDATSFGEREQLASIVRLAYGAVVAKKGPQMVLLDDPFAHSDDYRHTRMLRVIESALKTGLQIIIFTCHPERFDHLSEAKFIDMKKALASN